MDEARVEIFVSVSHVFLLCLARSHRSFIEVIQLLMRAARITIVLTCLLLVVLVTSQEFLTNYLKAPVAPKQWPSDV